MSAPVCQANSDVDSLHECGEPAVFVLTLDSVNRDPVYACEPHWLGVLRSLLRQHKHYTVAVKELR